MGINKIFGNRAGLALTATDLVADLGGGVFSTSDQYYARRRGGWGSGVEASGGTTVDYNDKRIHIFKSSGSFQVSALNGTPGSVEYVIIGGGGSGGSSGTNAYGGGGGGAGQVRTGTTTVVAATMPITIGDGGATAAAQNTPGNSGSNTTCAFPAGTITGYGGGGGAACGPYAVHSAGKNGNNYPSPTAGSGSGGGAGKGYPNTTYHGGPAPLGAYPGGSGPISAMYAGCGGGGAGGAGGNGPTTPSNTPTPNTDIGYGGAVLQIPTTFRSPNMDPTAPSPQIVGTDGPSGNFWVAGGGSAGLYGNPQGSIVNAAKGGAGGTGGAGPYGGAGNGGSSTPTTKNGSAASANTGSGGGGGGADVGEGGDGGAGGSGLVLIAYDI